MITRTDESATEFSLQECKTVGKQAQGNRRVLGGGRADEASAPLPATDIERARHFYAEKLGLTRSREMAPGHYLYECGGSQFLLYQTRGRASGTSDQMVFMVPDVEAAVRHFKARGVVFEIYDEPGAVSEGSVSRWTGEIAENEYRRTAWFKDSEGNLLNVAQRLDGKTV